MIARKGEAQELSESEAKYRSLSESMSQGFGIAEVLFGPDGRPTDFRWLETNPAFERQTGFFASKDKTVRELVPTLEAHWFEIYGEVAMTGERKQFVEHSESLGRSFEVEAFRIGDPKLRRVGVLFSDITERRRTEEALRESEARFRVAVNNAAFLPAQMDRQLRYQWIYNPHPDFDPATVLGKRDDEIEDSPAIRRLVALKQRVLDSGVGAGEEIAFDRSNGQRVYYVLVEPLRNDNDEIVGVTSASFDVTERVQAEQALRDSEQRYRQLADSMPQLVWLANAEGVVEYYNARIAESAGIEPREDGSWDWHPVVHEDDELATVQAWQRAVETGQAYEIEHRIHMRDGSLRWHLSRAYPVIGTEGVLKWFGSATDIHALKEAEQTLRESNRLKDQFMALVSHELRTPLTNIALYTELLQRRPQAAERIALSIRRNVQAQMRIVDDLLDSARITRGTLALKREAVELEVLVEEVAQDHAARIQAAGIELITKLEAVRLRADSLRLRQVLSSLLDNALKFTPAGGRITVSLQRRPSVAELAVTDTGRGIEPAFLPLVFQHFSQEEYAAAREYGGLGIGLYLTKGLVEAHGGRIHAYSRGRGHGTKMLIELPLHD